MQAYVLSQLSTTIVRGKGLGVRLWGNVSDVGTVGSIDGIV